MAILMAICPKCAWFKGRRVCKFCNVDMIPTETTVDDTLGKTDKEIEAIVNHYIETLIKDTYDPKAREYREANEKPFVKSNSITKNMVICPYCKSSNTTKISTVSKIIDTSLFGIFSTRRYRQWHCNSCGSDF